MIRDRILMGWAHQSQAVWSGYIRETLGAPEDFSNYLFSAWTAFIKRSRWLIIEVQWKGSAKSWICNEEATKWAIYHCKRCRVKWEMWPIILDCAMLFCALCHMGPTFLWLDNWHPLGPLFQLFGGYGGLKDGEVLHANVKYHYSKWGLEMA